jgi:hypothetical protein
VKNILSAWILILALSAATFAQHQRLAIPQGNFRIGPGGAKSTEAFCLDHNLFAPVSPIPYPEVISPGSRAEVRIGEGSPISLQEAIRAKKVRVAGASGNYAAGFSSGISVTFENLTSETISISLRDPVAIGERPGIVDSSRQIELLRTPVIKNSETTQGDLWTIGAHFSQLRLLGHLDDEGFTEAKGKAAILRFQKSESIGQTGNFDEPTLAALEKRVQAYIRDLAVLGFHVRDERVPNLGTAIRDYQSYLHISTTGRMTPSLRASIHRDLGRINEIAKVRQSKLSSTGYLSTSGNPDLVAFQKNDENVYALYRDPVSKTLEMWAHSPGGPPARVSGEKAIAAWDELSARIVGLAGGDGRLFAHLSSSYKPTGSLLLTIGADEMELQSIEVSRFLTGQGSIAALDKYVNSLSSHGKKPQIVLFRDGLFQGRGGDAPGNTHVLEGTDYARFDPLQFVIACNRRFQDKAEFYLANDVALAEANLAGLPRLGRSGQLRVVIDEKISDMDSITNIKPELARAGIRVVQARNLKPGQPGVVMIAGHNNEDFRVLVTKMAQEKRFVGSVIALASCGQGGEAAFNTEIIRASGARAVLFYNQKVHPDAVQQVLLTFAERIAQDGVTDSDFQRLWRESVREAAAHETQPELKLEIQKLAEALVQLSRTIMPRSSNSLDAD